MALSQALAVGTDFIHAILMALWIAEPGKPGDSPESTLERRGDCPPRRALPTPAIRISPGIRLPIHRM
jgi:hypothetical protein